MRKIKQILITLISIIAIYFAFAFIETELNPINFSVGSKVFFLMFVALLAAGGSRIAFSIEKD